MIGVLLKKTNKILLKLIKLLVFVNNSSMNLKGTGLKKLQIKSPVLSSSVTHEEFATLKADDEIQLVIWFLKIYFIS